MKKLFWVLLLLASVGMPGQAKKVTPDIAAEAAVTLFRQQKTVTIQSVNPVNYNGNTCYYVVNLAPQGWALISADDAVTPILGYSLTGHFMKDNLPDNCEGWLNNYANEINRIIQLKTTVRHEEWGRIGTKITSRAANDKVSPLISVKWNQGKPYNKYCPSDAKGTAVVGCVAVAMAQAMSVSQYPSRPVGEYGYTSATYGSIYVNYEKEDAYNWNAIMSGANNKDEIARLLYHCGVSIKMDYGVEGSGTQCSYIASALKRNFSYPESVTFYSRSGYTGDWKQLIVNELKAGRAVCYSGTDVKKGYGHCFNLDGYDGNNMFHVNWGWGGANDGYFSLDGLKDATMDMDYTSGQGVIVGIRPPSDKPSDIKLSNSTVKENQPAGTVVGKITVDSEASNPTYNYSVRGEYSAILHDYVKAPFTISDGELKTTEVLSAEDEEWNIEITAENRDNKATYTKGFTIYVISASEAEESPASKVSMSYDKVKKELILTSPKHITYTLYTSTDDVIAEGEITANGTAIVSIPDISAEYCMLQLSNMISSKKIKIITGK